jgi:hypothetical protein
LQATTTPVRIGVDASKLRVALSAVLRGRLRHRSSTRGASPAVASEPGL